MTILHNASEAEMVLTFLQEEMESCRFREEMFSALKECNVTEELIVHGDVMNATENALREKVLGKYRGYPDREIFKNYPSKIEWKRVRFEAEDLDRLRYISYSYWDELSKGTSKPSDAAKTVNDGVEIFGVSNQYFLDGRDALAQGKHFPPIIVLTDGNGPLVLIEGHCRATCYALVPECFVDSEAYAGFCTTEEILKFNPCMVK